MIFTLKVMQKLLAKLGRCRILQYLGMFKLSFFAQAFSNFERFVRVNAEIQVFYTVI